MTSRYRVASKAMAGSALSSSNMAAALEQTVFRLNAALFASNPVQAFSWRPAEMDGLFFGPSLLEYTRNFAKYPPYLTNHRLGITDITRTVLQQIGFMVPDDVNLPTYWQLRRLADTYGSAGFHSLTVKRCDSPGCRCCAIGLAATIVI